MAFIMPCFESPTCSAACLADKLMVYATVHGRGFVSIYLSTTLYRSRKWAFRQALGTCPSRLWKAYWVADDTLPPVT
jgi:hypothetical protein